MDPVFHSGNQTSRQRIVDVSSKSPMKTLTILLFGFVLWLSSCQAPTPAPTADISILRVQYTSTLSWLAPAFNLCTRQQAGLTLLVEEKPADALDLTNTDIFLSWGLPAKDQGVLFQLGSDDLAVVVHPQNNLQRLAASDLLDIFTGSIRNWKSVQENKTQAIQVWVYPDGNEVQQAFESAVLNQAAVFQSAHLAPSPAALRLAVAVDPNAIGFLPVRWVDSSIRILPIDDIPAETLRQPILASVKSAPQPAQKKWLVCIQESLNP
jgi:hypothetical protein